MTFTALLLEIAQGRKRLCQSRTGELWPWARCALETEEQHLQSRGMSILEACRFLTDLPKGLDSFNDICMEQQADSHVLEDNKKHVASIVQVRLVHSRPRPRAAAGRQIALATPVQLPSPW